MNVRQQIEAQRKVLEQMVGTADNLTELLQEAQKMDQLMKKNTQKQFHKGKRKQGCLQLQAALFSFTDF